MPALEDEFKTYLKFLPLLLNQKGKFALIHGSRVSGVFDTYSDAISNGYETLGHNVLFLVQQINPSYHVELRDSAMCLLEI